MAVMGMNVWSYKTHRIVRTGGISWFAKTPSKKDDIKRKKLAYKYPVTHLKHVEL